MKSFIIKIFWFSLPCLGLILLIEVLHQNIPHEFSERKKLIKGNKFNGYILGSSHTYFGLNPKKINSATLLNLGWPSQDLKTDFLIYNKLLRPEKFDYLVLDCSVFMLPYRQELEEKAVNKASYDIYYFNAFRSHILTFSLKSSTERIKKYFINKVAGEQRFLRMNNEGFSYRQTKVEVNEKAPEDGKRHNKYWENAAALKENLFFLSTIIAQNQDKKIVLYLPPLHPLYRRYIDESNWKSYFDLIQKLSNHQNVAVINFIKFFDKNPEFFQDGDHLLPVAADLVSERFNIALENNVNKSKNYLSKN